jgi:hypothetical protein
VNPHGETILSVWRDSSAVRAVPTAFALFAAFLNGAFNFCLGCEMYLLLKRFSPARAS